MASQQKNTPELLALIEKAQSGDNLAKNKICKIFEPYVEYMVSKYSKKTLIKENDDLRSYVYMGLLDGIKYFDPNRNTTFIYFSHIWMKKHIFLGEADYRFIKVPVNQKTFYEKFLKEHEKLNKEIEYELDSKRIINYINITNTITSYFVDIVKKDDEGKIYNNSEDILYHKCNENFENTQKKESDEILKQNIKHVMKDFSEKDVFVINHLYGLNGAAIMSSEDISTVLGVSKVHVNTTKTRVIKLLRHNKYTSAIFKGI